MKELSYLEADPEIVAKMMGTCVLDSFDEDHLVGLLKTSKIRSYAQGERIIEEGGTDTWIYMLISGKVRVEKKGLSLCVFERAGDIFVEVLTKRLKIMNEKLVQVNLEWSVW